MEAHKLRFVRCPGCLQLLVEYPSIPVYQCGGCGAVLRAKNRVVPAVDTNTGSGEQNGFSNSPTGDPQNNELICTREKKIAPSSNAQPSVMQEKITFASEERTMSPTNISDSGEHVNMGCSLVDGNVGNSDVRIEDIGDEDEGTVSNSSLDSMGQVEDVGTDGNANIEKGFDMDDESISNEVGTTPSMVHVDLGGGSNGNLTGEIESLAEGNCSLGNNNVSCQEIVAGCQPDDQTESKSNNVNCQEIVAGCRQDDVTESRSNNFSAGTKERSHSYEGLRVESHEDLIEELVRSLSLSDDEEDFVDIADNSELNDALRSQMGSCRFSSGNKMNDAPRTDPHGRLIEQLEMSFSDAEEQLDQNVMVTHDDIVEHVTLDEDGKEKRILDVVGAHSYEERVSPLDDGHLQSGQSFQQNELAAVSMEEKEEGYLDEINMDNHAEVDSGTVTVPSNLLDEKFCAIPPPSCDERKEEKSNRYRCRELRQGLSLDSEDFRSIQKFIESQMDRTSSSLSSGSPSHGDLEHKTSNKFKKIDRVERLKKMDDLRDQLNRLSSQKGLGNRYKSKGYERLQQQSSYKHIEHHPCGFDDDSILSYGIIDPYYDHGKPPSAWEFHSYYQSSYAGSTILEQDSFSSSYEEPKHAVRKQILRSLSGASPFTICNGCFNLVQVPADIYVSKRKIAKFQCGKCSKSLVISFPAPRREDTKFSEEVNKKPKKPVHNRVVHMECADSFSAECSRGDPVSITTEECGASFPRSFSGTTRPAVDASGSEKKVSKSALHRLMGYDSASQLLRHSRQSMIGRTNSFGVWRRMQSCDYERGMGALPANKYSLCLG
ncbi:hypothetical protein GUJ93_ZPchr0011g27586 [Zizania palustris]|uniref:Zinc-ribbon domain-containing protein n=1 Tax=Zizania palustris TaxID=103762 RepID=A0A8J6BPX2_ZIZPA|nr:hypothetical protein GUJ93_ZPchr0011g27586 [Zizania palustris]